MLCPVKTCLSFQFHGSQVTLLCRTDALQAWVAAHIMTKQQCLLDCSKRDKAFGQLNQAN